MVSFSLKFGENIFQFARLQNEMSKTLFATMQSWKKPIYTFNRRLTSKFFLSFVLQLQPGQAGIHFSPRKDEEN